MAILLVASCSTKKNTGATRFWHAFTGRYNTYYNGTLAYVDASLEKENGNVDDYTARIPLYTVGNKGSIDLGKANYERAILKCEKVIQLHSIKKRPEWNKKRRKTAKDIEWLSRKEYNPFIWRAWMLMGRSQFYKGDFDEAAATFAYMSRLFKWHPGIYGKAQAWLAKCYIENNWVYSAEDVIRNMRRDTIDWRAQKEWDYTFCDYYLHTDSLDKAAHYLRRVIKHEMRRKQRAREYYLLGQIEAARGNRAAAYEAFRKTLRQHPGYELAFNARISMTEVMAQGQAKKMIGKLKSMARDDNNADYQDQIYYAIGNIYLAEKDTTQAISAYESGAARATRAGTEKGVLLLRLGDLYWQREKFSDAKRCYGEALGLLDKDRKGYAQLSERSQVLDELVPHTEAIHLQDSLQTLAGMSEKDRNEAIDRVISELKRKEKEAERDSLVRISRNTQGSAANAQNNANLQQAINRQMGTNSFGNQTASTWYFYNPQAVLQGRQTFQRTWGKRENKDNWQRSNVTVVGADLQPVDEAELTDQQRDSIAAAEKQQEEREARMDSAVNDPHKREYYLAQIPFTEEQHTASDNIIKESLLKAGIIFKDKLDNLHLSEKHLMRLITQYPDCTPKDEIYNHLFLLYSRKGDTAQAETYLNRMKQECADSKLTAILSDPYFTENARYGVQIEDSIYGATYEAFKADRFKEVYGNAQLSEKRFPMGANRDRFLFIEGLTRLNDGDSRTCLQRMEAVVKYYPQSEVGEMAGMIINGVKKGRQLHGAKFDLANVWDRRSATFSDADSLAGKTFSKERNTDFLFVLAYVPDSLNENQLLFQLARYNFTSFMVRNFDLTISDAQGMHHLTVGGFRNFDEARQYARIVMQQENIRRVAAKARPIVISQENLDLIGLQYSYNDYDKFYVANFAPLPPRGMEQLYEPLVEDKPASRPEPDSRREAEAQQGTVTRELPDADPVAPALPGADVAPKGAQPDAKDKATPDDGSEEIKEDNNVITVPNDTEIIVTDEQKTEPTEIIVTDEPKSEPTEIIVTEEPKAAPTETVVSEEPAVVSPEEGTIVVDEPKAEAPKQTEVEVPIAEDNAPAAGDGIEIVDDSKEAEKDASTDEYFEFDGF